MPKPRSAFACHAPNSEPPKRPDRASRGGGGGAWPAAPRSLATDLRRTSKSSATAAFQSGVVKVTTITARRIKGHRAPQTSLGYCSTCPHQTTRPTPTLAQRSSRTSRVRGARSASSASFAWVPAQPHVMPGGCAVCWIATNHIKYLTCVVVLL